MKSLYIAGVSSLMIASASGQIFFDNFNVDEGHFASSPTASGQTAGVASATADRVTTDGPLEGAGHQKLVINASGAAALRIRHLSGGAAPVNNVAFSATAGTDGYIGYYLKSDMPGLETQLNLDTILNTGSSMWGGVAKPIIADGQWHLYEWNLDAAEWNGIPGIVSRTTGNLPNDTYFIDSIYIRDPNGLPSPSGTTYLDFVALNPNGSVALLVVPEPTTYATVFGLALAGLAGYRRLSRKDS